MAAARLLPQLIQGDTDRRAVKPGPCLLAVRRGIPRPLEKNLHRKLFGACRVANHSLNGARDPFVLSVKDGLDIEGSLVDIHFNDSFIAHVHNTTTPPEERL